MTTYALTEKFINGNPVHYAQMELAASNPVEYLAARIQRRDHAFPPALVYDWIGGYTLDGLFFQAGLLQQASGPDGSTPFFAFAWMTRSTGIGAAPGDPFPFTYEPLHPTNLTWVKIELQRFATGDWLVTANDRLVAKGPAEPLGSILVSHEVWSPTPTGLAGAFQHVTTDPSRIVVPPLVYSGPVGGAKSTTRGNVVLRDVGPSSEQSIVRWT